jgi:PHD/YefM family antitoxin component YafN of YafNO toxin-antitoxin module
MTISATVLDNIVSISEFSRGGASRAFEKAQGSTPVIVVKNNKPTAIITSPEEYAYLSETEEDFILLSEAIVRLARNETDPAVSFEEVLVRFGLLKDDANGFEDVEFEQL